MKPFEHAVLRVVPRVDRGECINGAVLLYCQAAGFLAARVRTDLAAVTALAPDADLEAIAAALAVCRDVALGAPGAGGMSAGQRFRWLTAPRSAVIQPGPVHTGVTDDPARELDRLAARLLDQP